MVGRLRGEWVGPGPASEAKAKQGVGGRRGCFRYWGLASGSWDLVQIPRSGLFFREILRPAIQAGLQPEGVRGGGKGRGVQRAEGQAPKLEVAGNRYVLGSGDPKRLAPLLPTSGCPGRGTPTT